MYMIIWFRLFNTSKAVRSEAESFTLLKMVRYILQCSILTFRKAIYVLHFHCCINSNLVHYCGRGIFSS